MKPEWWPDNVIWTHPMLQYEIPIAVRRQQIIQCLRSAYKYYDQEDILDLFRQVPGGEPLFWTHVTNEGAVNIYSRHNNNLVYVFPTVHAAAGLFALESRLKTLNNDSDSEGGTRKSARRPAVRKEDSNGPANSDQVVNEKKSLRRQTTAGLFSRRATDAKLSLVSMTPLTRIQSELSCQVCGRHFHTPLNLLVHKSKRHPQNARASKVTKNEFLAGLGLVTHSVDSTTKQNSRLVFDNPKKMMNLAAIPITCALGRILYDDVASKDVAEDNQLDMEAKLITSGLDFENTTFGVTNDSVIPAKKLVRFHSVSQLRCHYRRRYTEQRCRRLNFVRSLRLVSTISIPTEHAVEDGW